MSTHNLCLGTKIRKKVYPCKPKFYYIKVGCNGVFVIRYIRDDVQSYIQYDKTEKNDLKKLKTDKNIDLLTKLIKGS